MEIENGLLTTDPFLNCLDFVVRNVFEGFSLNTHKSCFVERR